MNKLGMQALPKAVQRRISTAWARRPGRTRNDRPDRRSWSVWSVSPLLGSLT